MKVLILAGGKGTRLWPLTAPHAPKAHLNILGSKTLLEKTLDRFRPIGATPYLITDRPIDYPRLIREPKKLGTMGAYVWGLRHLLDNQSAKKSDIVLISPLDHHFEDEKAFKMAIIRGIKVAKEGKVVLFGAKASRPSPSYGYIYPERKNIKFTEKPHPSKAQELIERGAFWNTGMVLARIDVIVNEIDHHAPLYNQSVDQWPVEPIDTALLEKSHHLHLEPIASSFTDLGTFESLYKCSQKDTYGNVRVGDVTMKECKKCYIHAATRPIVAIGVEDLVIVEGESGLLIARQGASCQIKQYSDF